jgi:hypothetical protein
MSSIPVLSEEFRKYSGSSSEKDKEPMVLAAWGFSNPTLN